MKRRHRYLIWLALFLLAPVLAQAGQSEQAGKQLLPAGPREKPFDVTRHSISLGDIMEGGPPRDGIPALTRPQFVSAERASRFLRKNDRVIGVVYNGEARAYPIRILDWHEAVNDSIGPIPFLVTW